MLSLAEMDMFLIAGAALAGLVFGLIANAVLRIRARQTDALKIEKTELIKRLAAAEIHVLRIPVLEETLMDLTTTLDGLRNEKASVDKALAGKAAAFEAAAGSIQDLRQRLKVAHGELSAEKQTVASIRAEIAGITAMLTQERSASDEQIALLTQVREQMTQEFKSLAEEVISRHPGSKLIN